MPALVQGFTVNNGDVASASYLNSWFSTGGVTVSAGRALLGNTTGTSGTTGTSNWQEITVSSPLVLSGGALSVTGSFTTAYFSGDTSSTIYSAVGSSSIVGLVISGSASGAVGNNVQGSLVLGGTVTATASGQTINGVVVYPNTPGISGYSGTILNCFNVLASQVSFSSSDTSGINTTLFVNAPRGGQLLIGSSNMVNYIARFGGAGSVGAVYLGGSVQIGQSFVSSTTSVSVGYFTVYDANGTAHEVMCRT